ncbi:MAG: DUF3644 domain-containing protein [Nanoarchaeota archaeon]|nr:DUF3644 domain-containing protein [Nanoarchaeota archaeon]
MARKRSLFSERLKLIEKSREAALSAVQIYNNPLTKFKTESFIVLFNIAWTYLLHAYYKNKKIDYRYYEIKNVRKKYLRNPDGTIRYWDLMQCLKETTCPLDEHTINNLKFLIGLRNEIVHRSAPELDSYLSARYQACALNYNHYLKKLHGKDHSLDENLALSLQFAELDYDQKAIIKDKNNKIPKNIQTYIATFDKGLAGDHLSHERFSYKLLFVKVNAKRIGQADRVIEFIDPKSELAKTITKEYWVKEDREKLKFIPSQVIQKVKEAGFSDFNMHNHTLFWKKHKARDQSKGYGVKVVKTWYWYENWIDFIISELKKVQNV